jgi:selenoprotein W-related protein
VGDPTLDVREEIAAAYACDRAGREAEAIAHYDRAHALGVPEDEQRDFAIGYGSTLRNVGRLRDSDAVLRRALARSPSDPVLLAFSAITSVTRGDAAGAIATALDALLDRASDDIGGYARAIAGYRDELRAVVRKPAVRIEYCPRCRWATRASWLAQELLMTFPEEISVTLVPGANGVLDVSLDGETVFSRASAGRFPEPKELKQAIRDRVSPGRDLGHSDG